MKKSIVVFGTLLCLCMAGELVFCSSLRVESMGGVNISVRDDENDPLAINPARVTFVKESKAILGLSSDSKASKSESKTEYSPYPPVFFSGNYYSLSESANSTLGLNLLGYLKPTKNFGTGVQFGYSGQNNKTVFNQKQTGKYSSGIYISTNTHEQNSENKNSLSPISVLAVGGYRFGAVNVGISYNMTPSYKSTTENVNTTIDNAYWWPYISTTTLYSSKTEATVSQNIANAGILLQYEKTSIDLSVNLLNNNQESRKISNVSFNVDTWKDDKDLYPVTKTKTTSTGINILANRKFDDLFTAGIALMYTPGDMVTTVEGSTITYDSTKLKSNNTSIGFGFGFEQEKDYVFGIDLSLNTSGSTSDSYIYNYDISGGSKTSTTENTMNYSMIKIGVEKYIYKNSFVLRGGAGKILSYNTNTKTITPGSNRTNESPYSATGIYTDYFTAGFGWNIMQNILLEYALTSPLNMTTGISGKHQMVARVTF